MKMTINRAALKAALAIVVRAIATKPTLPVLSNVLIKTDNGRLKLVATDLNIGITHYVPARVVEEGEITVPAKLFTDVIHGLISEEVTLTTDERAIALNIVGGRFETSLRGIEADEFPCMPQFGEDPVVTLEGKELSEALDQVAFAAADDDTRPVLAGVLMKFHEARMSLCAADGFRLSQRRIGLDQVIKKTVSVILVKKAALQAAAIFAESKQVHIIVNQRGSQILFRAGDDVELTARLIDGAFPDIERIIPQSCTTRVKVDAIKLRQAAKLAKVFATESQNNLRLEFDEDAVGSGRIKLTANANEIGSNSGEIEGSIEGESNKIAVNVQFLLDALDAISTEHVVLEIQSPQAPFVVKPMGKDGFVQVIMPMTIR
jgi:DNA polymerase III subunit beta